MRDQIGTKLPVAFSDLGEQQVKNIARRSALVRQRLPRDQTRARARGPLLASVHGAYEMLGGRAMCFISIYRPISAFQIGVGGGAQFFSRVLLRLASSKIKPLCVWGSDDNGVLRQPQDAIVAVTVGGQDCVVQPY